MDSGEDLLVHEFSHSNYVSPQSSFLDPARVAGVSGIENDLAPDALGKTGEMVTGHESRAPCLLALIFARILNLPLFTLKYSFSGFKTF